MNQLAVRSFGGSPVAMKGYLAGLRGTTRHIPTGMDRDILKIDSDTGEWRFGQDDIYVEPNDLWAVNPASFQHGWIAFEGRDIAVDMDGERAEIFHSVEMELPRHDELPELDVRKGKQRSTVAWKFQMGVDLVCIEGPNKGAQVVYKPSSMGGLKAMRKISEEVLRCLEDDENDGMLVPVVELGSSPYNNRTHGNKIHNPVLHIIEWASLDDTDFTSAEAVEEDDTKSRAAPGKGGSRDRRGGDTDKAREGARTARSKETTARGDKVDRRKAVDVDEDGEVVDEEADADPRPRGRRAAAEDAPRGRGRRDREEAVEDVEAAPRGHRGRRDRDAEVEEPAETPRGRRGARSRDEADEAEADAAPRGRRGRDAEDDGKAGAAGVRGRNAAAGGRGRR